MEQLESSNQIDEDIPRVGLNATERTYISRQGNLFHKMRSQLTEHYQGRWVLFENGQVLDSDEDPHVLAKRARQKLEQRIFFIAKVR